jgi:hypothetical protein
MDGRAGLDEMLVAITTQTKIRTTSSAQGSERDVA